MSALVAAADADRDPDRPLASALRVLALREFRLLSGAGAADGTAQGAAATTIGSAGSDRA